MIALIESIRRHIRDRDNLTADSAMLTVLILLLIFILTQLFGFVARPVEEEEIVRIELRERTPPVKFARQKEMPKRHRARGPVSKARTAQTAKTRNSKRAKPNTQSADFSSLVKSFNPRQFLKSEPNVRRTRQQRASQNTELTASLSRSTKTSISVNDLSLDVSSRPSVVPGGRRGAPGASASNTVDVGGPSRGMGSVSGMASGIAGGAGSGRTTRSAGGGGGGATISLPGKGDGVEATLDIHDLIKWMKEHPGPIPRLVGYEMGHKEGQDLSSAVKFTMQGRSFTMFLSVNERELLLRICLVEGSDFTLLKDNGIKETSHFLTTGDVLFDSGEINSLISSRRAPENKAQEFYRIFWSWWEIERAGM